MSQAAHLAKRQAPQQVLGCQLYLSPSANQIIEAYSFVNLQWDPQCINTEQSIDIYLQSLEAAQPVHLWKNVVTSSSQLSTQFLPEWWNSTTSAPLQLVISPSSLPLWAGFGPSSTFYAHFNGTIPHDAPKSASNFRDGKQIGGPSVDYITDFFHRSHHALSGGKLGAAIFLPLLAVAIAVSAFIFISRRRSGQASKRWSQYVDQRISTYVPQAWEDGASPPPLPSARGIPGERVATIYSQSGSLPLAGSRMASIYRHSASLPPRESMLRDSNGRMSTYSVTRPSSIRPTTLHTHSRDHSLAADGGVGRVSFSGRQSVVSFAPIPSELSSSQRSAPNSPHLSLRSAHHANSSISRSNLRFEVGSDPVVDGAVAEMLNASPKMGGSPSHISISSPAKPKALKLNTNVASSPLGADCAQSVSQPATTSSGMRRLDATSTLSPDEALRQYTLFRGGNDNVNGSKPSSKKSD